MPAYIRLLSYFSNFILLASFLGIGIGCLLAPARARLFAWFPVLTAAVIGAVYAFRLEVAIPPSGSIYFTSGTSTPVLPVESNLLLPVLFVSVAALLATAAAKASANHTTGDSSSQDMTANAMTPVRLPAMFSV